VYECEKESLLALPSTSSIATHARIGSAITTISRTAIISISKLTFQKRKKRKKKKELMKWSRRKKGRGTYLRQALRQAEQPPSQVQERGALSVKKV
jgi:hypothetical protein